ncbi:MAG: DUF2281 domain-containing protein [Cytophagales bacterium]|nr:DUF2281 domain-containing protein [Cytophagales bacterium]
MDNTLLYTKVNSLPENLKVEVFDFVDFLLQKDKKKKKKHSLKAGCLKGTFIMSDDFDEPLEDFKDYM